jgi:hypothetical protein
VIAPWPVGAALLASAAVAKLADFFGRNLAGAGGSK